VALLLGAPPLFIGLVLVGVGTSLPDWLVSAFAAAAGEDGLAAGNFIGSNTANIGLALGLAAVVTPIAVSIGVLRREALISIGAVVAVSASLIGGIGRLEGVLLLAALPVAFWVIRPKPTPEGDPGLIEASLARELAIAAATLTVTVIASRLLVDSASDVALELGISEAFIGLSLVAIGTSLPEIVVGVQSARRGQTDLVIGNVLGSNLVNSLGVAGTAALLTPIAPLQAAGLGGATVLMVGFALVAGLLLATGRRLLRWEGALLVLIYCATLPFFA
jgi:cation:H+ antiporter